MSSTAKLTAEQIENLAKEIREFLLEHGLWQDVDIYFNRDLEQRGRTYCKNHGMYHRKRTCRG